MLLIDCHEPHEIVESLKSAIPAKVIRLKYGDYSFCESDIIIERKTLSDFFSSLKSNRLKEQMEGMSRHYTEKYLLIEGFFDFSYVNNIGYLYSKLAEIMLDFDVRVVFSKDMEQSARLIKRIYLKGRWRRNSKAINRKNDSVHHAAKLFDISEKKLKIIFSKFGCIRDISNAKKKEFRGVKCIGNKTVGKIKNALESNIFDG